MAFLEKRSASRNSVPRAPSEADGDLRRRCPVLMDYLTNPMMDDGTRRLTSSVTVFCDSGVLKGVLNDRENDESLWAAGPGFMSILEALEAAIVSGTAEWRKNKRPGGRGGRGRREDSA